MKTGGRRTAFTLLETLVSVVLLTGLLLAGTALIIQVSDALAAQADDPVFERHADALERFLRSCRPAPGVPVTTPTGPLAEERGVFAFPVFAPRPDSPLFEGRPAVDARAGARLMFRAREGLWLAWVPRTATAGATPPVEKLLLTPWAESAVVLKYDAPRGVWRDIAGESAEASDMFVLKVVLKFRGRSRILLIPIFDAPPKSGGVS